MPDEPRSPSIGRRALDLLVFAPAGFILTAADDLPEMVEKGRTRLEGQLRTARTIGELAVAYGRQDLTRRLGRTAGPAAAPEARPEAPAEPEAEVEVRPEPVAEVPVEPEAEPETGPQPEPEVGTWSPAADPAGGATGEAGDGALLAIPDYDTLSASQVVRRLDGLGAGELDAVRRHEAAGRGRRTILHRTEQLLQAPTGPPGASPSQGLA